jgi:hypothetical protein
LDSRSELQQPPEYALAPERAAAYTLFPFCQHLTQESAMQAKSVGGGLNPHKSVYRKWRRDLATESGGQLWRWMLVADSGAHGATNG